MMREELIELNNTQHTRKQNRAMKLSGVILKRGVRVSGGDLCAAEAPTEAAAETLRPKPQSERAFAGTTS